MDFKQKWTLFIFFGLTVFYIVNAQGNSTKPEQHNHHNHHAPPKHKGRLLLMLFRHYNTLMAPHASPIHVLIRLHLSHLHHGNAKHLINLWNEMKWKDHRLSWHPKVFGGITRILIHPHKIWLPKIARHHIMPTKYVHYRVIIHHTGFISWAPHIQLSGHCDTTWGYFPFDEHTCQYDITDNGHTSKILLAENAKAALLKRFTKNEDWAVTGSEIYVKSFDSVTLKMKFQRRPIFYVLIILIPAILLSVMMLMMFQLPVESGQKMTMGLVLLLCYIVFTYAVSEYIPHASHGVPIMLLYLIFCFLVACISLALEVAVLVLYYNKDTTPSQDLLACLCCGSDDETKGYRKLNQGKTLRDNVVPMLSKEKAAPTDDAVTPWLSGILDELRLFREREERKDIQSGSDAERRISADRLDRLFFWLMLCLYAIGTLVILVIVPFGCYIFESAEQCSYFTI